MFGVSSDQNCMLEEINSSLNSGILGYRPVQNILSSHVLYRNVKIKTCRSMYFLLFHMGVKLDCLY